MNNQRASLGKENADLAVRMWPGDLGQAALKALNSFSEKYGFSIALGDLLLLDSKWYVTHAACFALLNAGDVMASRPHSNMLSLTPSRAAGSSRQPFTRLPVRKASSAMVTPIRRTPLRWSEAPKCVSPKREPLIGLSAKLTGSGSAVSKSSDRSRHRKSPSSLRRIRMATPDRTAQAMASPDCGTSSAS